MTGGVACATRYGRRMAKPTNLLLDRRYVPWLNVALRSAA